MVPGIGAFSRMHPQIIVRSHEVPLIRIRSAPRHVPVFELFMMLVLTGIVDPA